jgi:quercetin dioxygenase-like cupin family protein
MLHALHFTVGSRSVKNEQMTIGPAEKSTARAAVGVTLRQVRKARKLSLADVAEATGISASFLSLVEKDKSDITIGRLVRLIEFYGISITDLVPGHAASGYPEVVRPDERKLLHSPAEGIDVFLLTPDTQHQMMPLLVEFQPGARLAEHGQHPGEEWVLVLEGELLLELEGAEPRQLGPGHAAYYPAERPHLFSNMSTKKPLRVICVDTPPTM